ncbi:SMI1/KNR4 family protein [Polaribacter sp. Asnod6-C07]|uniref:SMI1/KNR4 family protein n=1 Tax=Polaribacter sp. Asnod6-C07 TaxID=3160582 RepID=UPI00386FB90E
MKELIDLIVRKHKENGIEINKPATHSEIIDFENEIGFKLPNDLKEFYLICNGFGCTEDIFNITPLSEITEYQKDYGKNWFYFSEYMIYSDMWGIRISKIGEYEIFNGSYPEKKLTSSFVEFLKRFLKGDVFENGGLYEWQEELGIK